MVVNGWIRRGWGWAWPAVRATLPLFLTARIWLSLLAVAVTWLFPSLDAADEYMRGMDPVSGGWQGWLLGPWQRWDALWYTSIASKGYDPADGSPAFFPLYVLLVRWGGTLLGGDYLLAALLASPDWQEALSSGLVAQVRAHRLTPGQNRNFVDTVVNQLVALNGPRVEEMVAQGCVDETDLFEALATWPAVLRGPDPELSFLGLNLTSACNFSPKCVYCNQPATPDLVTLQTWKDLVHEVVPQRVEPGPYIYLTGGEPLLLGEALWGDQGLVRHATERGCAVNINTNATMITPPVALRLIGCGLAQLHISLDTADPSLQNALCGGDQYGAILRGIYNVQLARDLLGVDYPGVHTNCVLTNRNADRFPELIAFLLDKRKRTADRKDPFYNDLFPHIIPVGGDSNVGLRPSEAGFTRFYEDTWADAERVWKEYQIELGVPEAQVAAMSGFFANPYQRVTHRGGLAAYARVSAEGRYGRLALARHCYVAPTQASFTPDGAQYYCGSHAIRHLLPIGNIQERGVFASIREGLAGLAELPDEQNCYGCALATLYINQSVEKRLQERVAEWLQRGAKDKAETA